MNHVAETNSLRTSIITYSARRRLLPTSHVRAFIKSSSRSQEREMIPYCRAHGIALIPYFALATGALSRPLSSHETE
jgi:aryl-alcohol dehydrogenase-like predicted oxidoreductase